MTRNAYEVKIIVYNKGKKNVNNVNLNIIQMNSVNVSNFWKQTNHSHLRW